MGPIIWITLRRITERSVLIQFGIIALLLAYVGLNLDSVFINGLENADDSALDIMWLFLAAFTIFWTTIEIPREIARHEEQIYLTKPMSRMTYLVGKFFGMTAMIISGETILLAVLVVCLKISGQGSIAHVLDAAARMALFLVLLNAMCVAASIVMAETPAMVTICIGAGLASLVFALPVLAWASFFKTDMWLYRTVYWVLPNLLHYRWPTPHGHVAGYLLMLALYSAGWSTLALIAGWSLLRGKDLS